jgi:hypothetical protein
MFGVTGPATAVQPQVAHDKAGLRAEEAAGMATPAGC